MGWLARIAAIKHFIPSDGGSMIAVLDLPRIKHRDVPPRDETLNPGGHLSLEGGPRFGQ
jgi:hypothetical protein